MASDLAAFKDFEHTGWSRVAHKYDATWAALTNQFIAPLSQAGGVTRGMRVLDVATGPGYVAAAAHRLGAAPLGLDFCSEMILQARRSTRTAAVMQFQWRRISSRLRPSKIGRQQLTCVRHSML
jgi:ubiquinone/menaquinone biosynthesis C-methylase UbiE